MTHTRAKQDHKRQRKITLRKMDRVVGTVAAHARRYRQLLDEKWDQTEWTRPQSEQVLRRIDQVLQQLPQARKQARERILCGQLVDNQEKILSLYEPEVRVIVRKKAGKDVEFGNTLLLGKNPQGLILDWELFKETAPADNRALPRSLQRMKAVFGAVLKELGADRGFDSQAVQEALQEAGIYNGVCPRSPHQLKERSGSWKFKKLQRRRGQTEGRVAIRKNVNYRLRVIDWFCFEKLMGMVFQKQGYIVSRRGGANPDGGIDIMVEKAGEETAVQCKHWRTRQVGVRHIREFLGALTDAGLPNGFLIALSGCTADAEALAQKHAIQIIEEEELLRMLESADANFDPEIIALLNDERKYCPKCEAEMVLRTAGRGSKAGEQFRGCLRYPRCRMTAPFDQPEV